MIAVPVEVQSWMTLIKDGATVAGAILAAYFTHQGLSTWKRQLMGNANFTLAKNLLVSVVGLRHAATQLSFRLRQFIETIEHSPDVEIAKINTHDPDIPIQVKILALRIPQDCEDLKEVMTSAAASRLQVETNFAEAEALLGLQVRLKLHQLVRFAEDISRASDILIAFSTAGDIKAGSLAKIVKAWLNDSCDEGPISVEELPERLDKLTADFENLVRPHIKQVNRL